jgi:DNA-binding PucR family transcriptional regulator
VVGRLPSGEVLALVQVDLGQDPEPADGDVGVDWETRLMDYLERAGPGRATTVVAAGGTHVGALGIRHARSEAIIAYEAGRRRSGGGVIRFADLGLERVLARFPLSPVIEEFVGSMVAPLRSEPELLRTLATYLETGGNKVATASRLELHRSSLIYRLRKISLLLRTDVDDPVRQYELSLALRLDRQLDERRVTPPHDR